MSAPMDSPRPLASVFTFLTLLTPATKGRR